MLRQLDNFSRVDLMVFWPQKQRRRLRHLRLPRWWHHELTRNLLLLLLLLAQ